MTSDFITPRQLLEDNYQWFCVQKHPLAKRKPDTAKSSDIQPLCLYRADDGRRCSIGCSMPDWLYNPEYDNANLRDGETDIDVLIKYYPDLADYYRRVPLAMLTDLQTLHDGKVELIPEHYLIGLLDIAIDYNIDWTPGC